MDDCTRVCQCCPQPITDRVELDRGRLVCRGCEQRMLSQLREVAQLWPHLATLAEKGTPLLGADDAPRPTGPSGSQAPGDLAVLSLLAGGVTGPLLVEEDAWRRHLRGRGFRVPLTPWRGDQDQTLRGCLAWLLAHLNWAVHEYEDVDDLDRALRKILGSMRGVVTGDRRRAERLPLPCPLPARGHDEDDPGAPACGGDLVFDPRRAVIRCGGCLRTLRPSQWHRLGATLTVPRPDAA
jgi:hypothetical protein